MGKKRIKEKSEEESKDGAAKTGAEPSRSATRSVARGIFHIQATYNNTLISITDEKGNVLAASSSGAIGFRGTKKSTPYAAARVAEGLSEKVARIQMPEVVVLGKGGGSGGGGGRKGKGEKGEGRRGGGSQFAVELREKQKVRYLYGLREAMLRRYFEEALRDKKHPTGDALINMLEKRLDNVMFRAGLAPSRNTARHLVSYGHVLVNGRAVNKPSYIVRKGDVVELKQKSSSNDKILTETQKAMLKKFAAPLWMKFNVDDLKIEIVSQPYDTDLRIDPKMRSVVEFYSRRSE